MYASPYPKIDAHAHVCGRKDHYLALMNALDIRSVLNISWSNLLPPDGLEQYEASLLVESERYPGRFHFCTSFSIVDYANPGYAEQVIAKLRRDFDERGAVAVKLWKDLGMMLRDVEGKYVFCDDPAFLPIYDFIVGRGIPILMHIADPLAAWGPLDPSSPHYGYYQAFPEFHWYGQADKPSHAEILAHRDALVARYPAHPFVCAHLASLEHDTDALAALFDAHPNASADLSARIADLQAQPNEKIREFLIAHHDRILYGIDWDVDEHTFSSDEEERRRQIETHADRLSDHYRYLEETLDLPPDVLERIYTENAERIYRLSP